MPNVHLRDLPPATLEILKESAQVHGRSLNAELISLLNDEAERMRRTQDFLLNVKPKKARKSVDLEALIRSDREARSAGAL